MEPLNPRPSSTIDAGSGIAAAGLCPSTTKLSIRLLPVAAEAPLNTMRNAALELLFNPVMLPRSKVNKPKDVGGLYGALKLTKVIPLRLYWNWLLLNPVAER